MSANGTPLDVVGQTATAYVYVISKYTNLLGADFLQHHGAVLRRLLL